MKDIDVLCIGEPMAEFAEIAKDNPLLLSGFGGDTMNTAVAVARQGARAAVFTAVGDDPFGRRFIELWDREGVQRGSVITRVDAPTGIYFVTHEPTGHSFTYYRTGSAASRMTPAELPLELIRRSRVIHFSAISQAISQSARETIESAVRSAKASGALISYDANLRLKLWSLETARETIFRTAVEADIIRPSIEDARLLLGIDEQDAIVDRLLSFGAKLVVLILGADGALVATDAGDKTFVAGHRVAAVDATGAGDCFTGSFLAEYLRAGDPVAAAGTQMSLRPCRRRAEVQSPRFQLEKRLPDCLNVGSSRRLTALPRAMRLPKRECPAFNYERQES